jgi:hypothetical protein
MRLRVEPQQIQPVGFRRTIVVAALCALAAMAIAAVAADRASAEPAICSEYPGLSQCEQPATGGGDTGGGPNPADGGGAQSPIPGAGGASAAAGGGASGALPFTGYPLTPAILLLLALLVAGLAIRGYVALRERTPAQATHS